MRNTPSNTQRLCQLYGALSKFLIPKDTKSHEGVNPEVSFVFLCVLRGYVGHYQGDLIPKNRKPSTEP
jgi:hypothetical protein